MKPKIPDYCRSCTHLHTGGIKDGKHDRWCCLHSGPAPVKWRHCRNVGGRQA